MIYNRNDLGTYSQECQLGKKLYETQSLYSELENFKDISVVKRKLQQLCGDYCELVNSC